MINEKLFTVRNVLVIAVFAIVWQLVLSRVNPCLNSRDASATADATY